jgi:hypothetical protein
MGAEMTRRNCDITMARAHDPEKWVPVFGKDHAPSAKGGLLAYQPGLAI